MLALSRTAIVSTASCCCCLPPYLCVLEMYLCAKKIPSGSTVCLQIGAPSCRKPGIFLLHMVGSSTCSTLSAIPRKVEITRCCPLSPSIVHRLFQSSTSKYAINQTFTCLPLVVVASWMSTSNLSLPSKVQFTSAEACFVQQICISSKLTESRRGRLT